MSRNALHKAVACACRDQNQHQPGPGKQQQQRRPAARQRRGHPGGTCQQDHGRMRGLRGPPARAGRRSRAVSPTPQTSPSRTLTCIDVALVAPLLKSSLHFLRASYPLRCPGALNAEKQSRAAWRAGARRKCRLRGRRAARRQQMRARQLCHRCALRWRACVRRWASCRPRTARRSPRCVTFFGGRKLRPWACMQGGARAMHACSMCRA